MIFRLPSLVPFAGLARASVYPQLFGAGVPDRQHEAVSPRPVRVGGVVPQEVLPQRIRHRGGPQRRAGMAAVGPLHGIDGQRADGVDRQVLDAHRG